jgi:hypothetical protein
MREYDVMGAHTFIKNITIFGVEGEKIYMEFTLILNLVYL